MGRFVYHNTEIPEKGKKGKWLEENKEVGE